MKKKMKKGHLENYKRFSELMMHELFVAKTDAKEISDQQAVEFRKKLAALDLEQQDVFRLLFVFFRRYFMPESERSIDAHLLPKREMVLSVYSKIFASLFDGLNAVIIPKELIESEDWVFYSPKEIIAYPKELIYYKADLVMFLLGIVSPDELDISKENIAKSKKYRLQLFAESDENILITGETGTGKELYARTLHFLSPRANGKFYAINCAGIPESLLESQIFGIAKGIATGVEANDGILNAVGEGGTLFLDEIGDMPLTLQAKLLRVLQTREFNKVGDHKHIYRFGGRVIAATHLDLDAAIIAEPPKFRSDLYYRLNVLPLKLQSLHSLRDWDKRTAIILTRRKIMASSTIEKPSDLVVVGNDTIKRVPVPHDEVMDDFTQEARDQLLKYPFPGNYRELHNVIHRALILSEGKIITPCMLEIPTNDKKLQDDEIKDADVNTIPLKDIIEHARQKMALIIRSRIKAVYLNGQNLKEALAAEGVDSTSAYQTFRNKVETIIGQGEIGKIKKEFKLSK